MKKKYSIWVLAVLLIASALYVGYNNIGRIPRVSQSESREVLSQYKTDITDAYNELNSKYEEIRVMDKSEEWEAFSGQWIQRLVKLRPQITDKRFPARYEEHKQALMLAQKNLLPLWKEYNSEITEKNGDMEKIEELKKSTQALLDSVDI